MNPDTTAPMTTKLLTLDQVADALAVSTRTVRRLIDNKDLRCVTVGRQKRVVPKDLEAFLKANKE
jgi:excisionase family DNA binding protein